MIIVFYFVGNILGFFVMSLGFRDLMIEIEIVFRGI